MKNIVELFKWLGKNTWYILAIILALIILQFSYSYIALLVQYVINVLGDNSTSVNLPSFVISFLDGFEEVTTILLVVGIMLVLLQLFRSILRFIESYFRTRAVENVSRDMRNKLYEHFCDLSYSYQSSVDVGDLIQRTTSDVDTSSTFLGQMLPELFNIFITAIVGAYQIAVINMNMMLISMVIFPFIAIFSVFWFLYMNKKFLEVEEAESKFIQSVSENVNASRVVRAFGNEIYESEKIDNYNKEFTKADNSLSKKESIYWAVCDFMMAIQYAITTAMAIYLASKGIVNAADITACLLLIGMLVFPIRGLGRVVSELGKALVASKRINEVLEEKSELEDNGTLLPQINGNIEFKNVNFKFIDSNDNLLNDVSFKINSGEVIAIVGKTGSGKSTICNLITRFLECKNGEIFIDGINIKEIDKHHLRKNIRMVLQNPFLFTKTVYENLKIASPDASECEILNAARIAHIDSEIVKFKDGYETLVGEKGTTLSGGQQQRLSIARMLVSNAPVLIFDDSLSALDTKTDYQIRNALKKREHKQTMIIITHRTTTAMEADRILVLNNGQIEAFDTHENLIKKDGFYKELCLIQGNIEDEFNSLGGEINGR